MGGGGGERFPPPPPKQGFGQEKGPWAKNRPRRAFFPKKNLPGGHLIFTLPLSFVIFSKMGEKIFFSPPPPHPKFFGFCFCSFFRGGRDPPKAQPQKGGGPRYPTQKLGANFRAYIGIVFGFFPLFPKPQ